MFIVLYTFQLFYIFCFLGLRISEVSSNDEGQYTCRADNIAGTKEMSANLYIQEAPEVVANPAVVIANMSSSIFVHCNATGVPPPVITWSFKVK